MINGVVIDPDPPTPRYDRARGASRLHVCASIRASRPFAALALIAPLAFVTYAPPARAQTSATQTSQTQVPPTATTAAKPRPARAEPDESEVGAEFLDTPNAPVKPADSGAPASGPASSDDKVSPGYIPGYRNAPGLGLPPYVPEFPTALPGGVSPSFAAPVAGSAWRFSFSGYMQAGVRASIGERELNGPRKGEMTLHGDPLVPGSYWGWFEHTNTVIGPWAQLNFSAGNDKVRATAIVAAWNFGENDVASGYVQLPSKLWVNDAFLTFTPDLGAVRMKVLAGVYPERYGAMGKYNNGAYALPFIGWIRGVGVTPSIELPLEGDVDVNIEAGVKGNLNFAPRNIYPDASNEFVRPWEGATYAAHGHVGASYAGVQPAIHAIHTWSQDDRADRIDDPQTPAREDRKSTDGQITVLGADVRVDGGRYGYLYLGGSRVTGKAANTVANVVTVMNTYGGRGLTEQYFGFGSNGNGTLSLLGTQYTVSLGGLLRPPHEVSAEAPDLTVSVFGVLGKVDSDAAAVDGRKMFKYGAEVVYSMLPWLAASGRVDHAIPDMDRTSSSFAVLSPKLIFRTNWVTREALTLQYARYVVGSDVVVTGDTRLQNSRSGYPDKNLLTLYGTIWW